MRKRSGKARIRRVAACLFMALAALYASSCAANAPASRPPSSADQAGVPLDEHTRNYDQLHIRVEGELDFTKRQLSATATVTLRPTCNDLHGIFLHCMDMEIDHVKLNGRRVDHSQHTMQDHLWIEFGRGYDPADELALQIKYISTPTSGIYFFSPTPEHPGVPLQAWTQGQRSGNRHWIPCYDLPDDRVSSELIMTVPSGLVFISNGTELASTPVTDRLTRHHWTMTQAHATYLISFVAGELERIKRTQDETYHYGFNIPAYATPHVDLVFGRTHHMMKFFEDITGQPYPYEKYDQTCVWDFLPSGMENTSATTLTVACLHDERAYLDYQADYLIAHELAHMWFGDFLTCKTWDHISQNEGFATYFEDLWVEQYYGKDEFWRHRRENNETYFDWATPERLDGIQLSPDEYVPVEISMNAYQRGSAVLHMLRRILGDEVFIRAVRAYVKNHAGGLVTSEDWRAALESACGKSLQWFFDQWYYKGVGYPALEASWIWSESKKRIELQINQTQRVGGNFPLFTLPLDIELDWGGGRLESKQITVKKKHQIFYFNARQKPAAVLIDPENWCLKKINFQKTLDEWRYQLLSARTSHARVEAARALETFGEPAIPALFEALKNRDTFWEVRAEAARSLDAMRRGGTLARLMHRLAEPASPVCRAVDQQWDDSAGLQLYRELLAAQQSNPSTTTLDALRYAADDPHPRVRKAAAVALAAFEPAHSEETLLQLVREDPSEQVQGTAAQALILSGSEKAHEESLKIVEIDSRLHFLRTAVIQGLTLRADKRVLELARRYVTSEHTDGHRTALCAAALESLALLAPDSPETLDALRNALSHANFHMRRRACEWIVRLHATDALDALAAQAGIEPLQSVKTVMEQSIDELKNWKGVEEE